MRRRLMVCTRNGNDFKKPIIDRVVFDSLWKRRRVALPTMPTRGTIAVRGWGGGLGESARARPPGAARRSHAAPRRRVCRGAESRTESLRPGYDRKRTAVSYRFSRSKDSCFCFEYYYATYWNM